MASKIKLTRKTLIREVDSPTNVTTTLYPHQQRFLAKAKRWEEMGHGGLLGAEMGTGKTLMILSLYADSSIQKKTIVVAPLALLKNWEREFKTHLTVSSQHFAIYHGKTRYLTPLENRTMIVTTYDTVRQDIVQWGSQSPLIKFGAKRIVLDEAHEIKNPKSQRFLACLKLPGQLRWAMTGTPVQNYREDLISLAMFLQVAPFNEPEWWAVNANDEALKSWKRNYYIYFAKSQLNLNLPKKNIHNHVISFTRDDEIMYRQMKEEAQELFDEFLDLGSPIQFGDILTKILRLKQICNHSYGTLPKEEVEWMPDKDSAKFLKTIEIINEIPAGEKVLVFSQFRYSLELLQQSLDRHGYEDQSLMYNGTLSLNDKELALHKFSNNDSKRILLMSIKAGGVGLNLTEANHVIILDPWWNRAIEYQAIDRAHRIGQTRDVQVHRLSMKNSIEQWILGLQEHKLLQANKLLDLEAEAKNFSQSDLRRLFKEGCF